MTALCEETLQKICELMGSIASLRAVADAVGISESCLYQWRARCEKDRKANDLSSPFLFSFRGQTLWLTEAAALCRAEHLCTAESVIRQQSVDGIKTVVRDASQEIKYAKDIRFIGRSDDWVMLDTGCERDEVEYHRLAKDPATGLPYPETKTEQVPAPIRLAVLRAADPAAYREHTVQDVNAKISVVHTAAPMLRKPDEPRPDIAELRRLAADLKANGPKHPHATDANGRRMMPLMSPALHRDPADDAGNGLAPGPAPFQRPQQPASPVLSEGRPSYAKVQRTLDHSGIGRGTPPDGGGPANARGNVR